METLTWSTKSTGKLSESWTTAWIEVNRFGVSILTWAVRSILVMVTVSARTKKRSSVIELRFDESQRQTNSLMKEDRITFPASLRAKPLRSSLDCLSSRAEEPWSVTDEQKETKSTVFKDLQFVTSFLFSF
jgi:hypothetical protein